MATTGTQAPIATKFGQMFANFTELQISITELRIWNLLFILRKTRRIRSKNEEMNQRRTHKSGVGRDFFETRNPRVYCRPTWSNNPGKRTQMCTGQP